MRSNTVLKHVQKAQAKMHHLARLAVKDQFLDCFVNDQLAWRTEIDSILLIAEYTTNEGPFVDDYFVELWSLENGAILKTHVTFYSTGRDAAFAEIAKQLGSGLDLRSRRLNRMDITNYVAARTRGTSLF